MRIILVLILLCYHCHTLYAEELWTTYTTENGLNINYIHAIAVDNNNVKWILQSGSYYGATSTFDGTEWKEPPKLARRNFDQIAIGLDNVVWFGRGYELFKYNNDAIIELANSGLDSVRDLYVDENNILWISDKGDFEYPPDMFTFDGTQFTKVLDEYLHHVPIWEMAQDSNNDIWLTGYGAIYKYTRTDNVVNKYLTPEPNEVRNIVPYIAIDKNDVCWTSIAYPDSGVSYLASFQDEIWTVYNEDNSILPRGLIRDLIVDQNDNIWIATDDGLVRFDGDNWTVFSTDNSGLVNDKVRCLAVEHNNTLWIGTEGGLSKYTGETITAIDEELKPEALPTVTSYPNPFNPSTTIQFHAAGERPRKAHRVQPCRAEDKDTG